MILETVNNKTYRNLPRSKIVPTLADQGTYLASESSIYRILRENNQLQHRGSTRPKQHHKPKAFEAWASNQVWTWDITYMRSQVRGLYFYLYLMMDI